MSNQQLIDALAPFVAAYEKAADHIGDSDLYDEQPRGVWVTLGDCRRARRVMRKIEAEAKQIAAKAELRDLGVA